MNNKIIYLDYQDKRLFNIEDCTPFCSESFETKEKAREYILNNKIKAIIIYRQNKI